MTEPIKIEHQFVYPVNAMTERPDVLEAKVRIDIRKFIDETCEAQNLVFPEGHNFLCNSGFDPTGTKYIYEILFTTRRKTEDELYVEKLEYFLKQNNLS